MNSAPIAALSSQAQSHAPAARPLQDNAELRSSLSILGYQEGAEAVSPRQLAQATGTTDPQNAPIIDQHRMNHRYKGAFCGIATLLSTLSGAGKNPGVDISNSRDLDRFSDGIYIPGAGSSGVAMARKLQDFGQKDARFITTGTTAQVVATVQAGKPVPVGFVSMGGKVTQAPKPSARYGAAIKPGANHEHRFGPSGHWATVVGIEGDPTNPTHFIINDSDTGAQLKMTRADFERHTAAHEGIWMIPH